jgi:hypothetical protein
MSFCLGSVILILPNGLPSIFLAFWGDSGRQAPFACRPESLGHWHWIRHKGLQRTWHQDHELKSGWQGLGHLLQI